MGIAGRLQRKKGKGKWKGRKEENEEDIKRELRWEKER